MLPWHRPFLWFSFEGQFKVPPLRVVPVSSAHFPFREAGIHIPNYTTCCGMVLKHLGPLVLQVNWEKIKLFPEECVIFLSVKLDLVAKKTVLVQC